MQRNLWNRTPTETQLKLRGRQILSQPERPAGDQPVKTRSTEETPAGFLTSRRVNPRDTTVLAAKKHRPEIRFITSGKPMTWEIPRSTPVGLSFTQQEGDHVSIMVRPAAKTTCSTSSVVRQTDLGNYVRRRRHLDLDDDRLSRSGACGWDTSFSPTT